MALKIFPWQQCLLLLLIKSTTALSQLQAEYLGSAIDQIDEIVSYNESCQAEGPEARLALRFCRCNMGFYKHHCGQIRSRWKAVWQQG